MLDFLGKAAQGIVAKLRRPAANFRRFVAHGIGTPAKPLGYAAQHRGNGIADMVGGLNGTRGRSDTRTFQTLFHRPQAPFDFTNFGGHRAGESGLTKHDELHAQMKHIARALTVVDLHQMRSPMPDPHPPAASARDPGHVA
jgi:hypothetical protein